MLDLDIYTAGLTAVMGIGIGAWGLSIPLRDVGIADPLWPLLFVVMSVIYLISAPEVGTRSYLVFFLVTFWASRLGFHLLKRNRGVPEDWRYRLLREANAPGFQARSLYMVFGMQAVLAWIVSLPLHGAILSSTSLGWLDIAGIGLFAMGLALEAVADQQLTDFKSAPDNRNQVLTTGLWRYSRHPNYFGEVCVWWGFFLIALNAGAWWGILSPLLVIYMVRWPSVSSMEDGITGHRPGYRHYIGSVNTLLPGPPRPRLPPIRGPY